MLKCLFTYRLMIIKTFQKWILSEREKEIEWERERSRDIDRDRERDRERERNRKITQVCIYLTSPLMVLIYKTENYSAMTMSEYFSNGDSTVYLFSPK